MVSFDSRGLPKGIVSADLSLFWLVVTARRHDARRGAWKAETIGPAPTHVELTRDGDQWRMIPAPRYGW